MFPLGKFITLYEINQKNQTVDLEFFVRFSEGITFL